MKKGQGTGDHLLACTLATPLGVRNFSRRNFHRLEFPGMSKSHLLLLYLEYNNFFNLRRKFPAVKISGGENFRLQIFHRLRKFQGAKILGGENSRR